MNINKCFNSSTSVLVNMETHYDDEEKIHYMTVEYKCMDKYGNVDDVSIVDVPIHLNDRPVFSQEFSQRNDSITKVDLGFGELVFSSRSSVVTERIHTVTKEMTIEEIEKALGYSVKIVAEKEK